MRVLHVIDKLNTGGAEKLFVTITQLLASKGTDVAALLFNKGGHLDTQLNTTIKLHILNRQQKFSLAKLYQAHKICSTYDIVHAHLRHVHAYIRLAQWLFRGKYKLLLHDHAAITDEVPVRLKGILKPKYYIGVNTAQANWAMTSIGVEKGNLYLLENTATVSLNSTVAATGTKRAMIIANIRQVKNIEMAIALCKKMMRPLDIYGNIIEQEYFDELKMQIGNDDTIRIIQGVTDFSDIYHQYSIAIHCSHAETGPLVLIEYLAAGLPFIAYQSGSAADAIAQSLPQLFMNNHQIAEWEQCISEIMGDEQLPSKMKSLYRSQFNPEEYINKCLDIYQNVLSS